MDIDIRDFRRSDELLEELLRAMIDDIAVGRKHGYYTVSLERLVLIELMARELERKKGYERIYSGEGDKIDGNVDI